MRAVPLYRMAAAASIRPFSGAAAAQIGLACKRATMIPPPYSSFSFLVSSSTTSSQRLLHRRGYAIMDRYRKINKNDGQAPGAGAGAEATRASGGEADQAKALAEAEAEAAKVKAQAKRRMRGVIPLRHLRSEPPPEVVGIMDDSRAPGDAAGRVLEVTLLGAPNAGKSSLANALLQTRVSAVSKKAQTTRREVIGIMYDKDSNTQVVLSDTPGVVPPRLQKSYGRDVAVTGWESMQEADVVAVVVDAARKVDDMTLNIVNRLGRERSNINAKEILLILNKMDLVVPRDLVLPKVDEYNRDNIFTETFFISALKETGLDELKNHLISKAAPGDMLYPTEWRTDQSLLEQAEELIREKIFQRTNGDVPYRVSQENLAWYTSNKDASYVIHHNILVPNVRLKKILVGEGGRTIQCISLGVREELEKLCHRKVHLFLEVKVQKNNT